VLYVCWQRGFENHAFAGLGVIKFEFSGVQCMPGQNNIRIRVQRWQAAHLPPLQLTSQHTSMATIKAIAQNGATNMGHV